MTIDKAIQILKGEPGPQFIIEGKDAFLAAQLGIEALKEVKRARDGNPALDGELLLGETEN